MKQFTPSLPPIAALHPVRAMAAAFNLLTLQQPWAAERLARHAGKTIRISLGGFSITLTIDSQGHLEQSDAAVIPDVVLEVVAEKLTVSRLFQKMSQETMADMVHISGQAALAQLVSELARDLRPDPEDALAKVFGDIAARKLVKGANTLFHTVQTACQNLTQNVAEYLSEETDTLASRPALTLHGLQHAPLETRISTLSDRQTRLVERLDRLIAKRSAA